MLLTDTDLSHLRRSLEASGGWDPELLQRTSSLVHVGALDEAVRNAFVLLEDRLRRSAGREGTNMTGTKLADYALNAEQGPLAKNYGHNRAEREGLHALFAGGFKLFRNPAAHRVVDFDTTEARFILGYVNLLLHLLRKITSNQPATPFPQNVEEGIAAFERSSDSASASRLRAFLNKCANLGLTPRPSSKVWIAFRHYALTKQPNWTRAKPHPITVFYFYTQSGQQGFWFPVNQYQKHVVGFDPGWVARELRDLGFQQTGAHQDFNLLLKQHARQELFDRVTEIVEKTITAFRATLNAPSALSDQVSD